jgi:transposase
VCTKCQKQKDERKFAGGKICNDCKHTSESSEETIKTRINASRFAEFFNHSPNAGERLTVVQRSAIVTLSSLGLDVSVITRLTACDERTIDKWVSQFKDTGSLEDLPRVGRKRVTTEDDDEEIAQSARDKPRTVPKQIRNSLQLDVSARTVRRRLDEAGLFGRVARMEYPFTDRHLQSRFDFAQDHLKWTSKQWQHVVYADEAYICLGESGEVWVQRPTDTAWMKEYMVQSTECFPLKIGMLACFLTKE